MPDETIRVRGLRELIRAANLSGEEVKLGVRGKLKEAGQIVASEARSLFDHIDGVSAAGYRPSVRAAGRVVVQQSKRKVTGKRPDYGALQMRDALLPALAEKSHEVEGMLESVLDDIAERHW